MTEWFCLCPFCGDDTTSVTHHAFGRFSVQCENPKCFATGPRTKARRSAIRAWNKHPRMAAKLRKDAQVVLGQTSKGKRKKRGPLS